MNKQREIIYDERRKVLFGENLKDYIMNMTYGLIQQAVEPITLESRYPEEWDFETLNKNLKKICDRYQGVAYDEESIGLLTYEQMLEDVMEDFRGLYAEKEAEVGEETMRELERMILLRIVDSKWMDHIDAMDQLKSGIGLRGLGGQDPAGAYAQEGFDMFEEMIASIQEETVKFCYNVTVETQTERRRIIGGGMLTEGFEDDANYMMVSGDDYEGYDEIPEYEEKSQKPDFWNDNEAAQKILKEKKQKEVKLTAFESLASRVEDLEVLLELIQEADDKDAEMMEEEASESYDILVRDLENLKISTMLSGEYDANNAILQVHGGSGGADAKDWAGMLFRMYLRWGEQKGYKVSVTDYQDNEEGGINSATVLVVGDNAYGYLKHEKGVHRLVRISPFDSSGRRHTSFASVDVVPEIEDDISIDIDPEDIRIDTYRASGAGGQHVNKTDSAVRITHIPTNIVVSCQNERSQFQNKDTAMKLLKSKLMELALAEQKENLKELQGDYSQITWSSQIRSYVFHPYTMVKDHRTGAEVGNVQSVMDGDLDIFINEELKQL